MKKVLVANRGEIALRIMRTLQRMGIKTVAVYSEADVHALHVRFADEAYCLGPAPSNQSYLRGDAIIEICLEHNVDGLHPGYGFLAENTDFCRKVKQAGITFIGPTPEAMEQMGSKISAKSAVKAFGVPLVPGIDYALSDVNEGLKIAQEIGFPLLIKASAGGGGKGMRTVERMEDFKEQMNLAVGESISAFGDGSVFIERLVRNPRHIEVQVLADHHGNAVYLFERECSVQRRHQKVVEEAPSAVLTPVMRQKMGEAAINVVRASNYTNAGTVEFLADNDLNFYFLEMNTRLQVEHPVTEYITGLDIVEEQVRVARGEKLRFTQDDLKIDGHAIEIRVCAEDPNNNFLPDVGTLLRYREPIGKKIRVDSGFEEGMEIPIYYDPMIAKLIVHAPTRLEAIERMIEAINAYEIVGIETTLDFCRFVMEHEAFRSGNFDTGFIGKYFDKGSLNQVLTEDESETVAITVQNLWDMYRQQQPDAIPQIHSESSEQMSDWRKVRTL